MTKPYRTAHPRHWSVSLVTVSGIRHTREVDAHDYIEAVDRAKQIIFNEGQTLAKDHIDVVKVVRLRV